MRSGSYGQGVATRTAGFGALQDEIENSNGNRCSGHPGKRVRIHDAVTESHHESVATILLPLKRHHLSADYPLSDAKPPRQIRIDRRASRDRIFATPWPSRVAPVRSRESVLQALPASIAL